MIRFGSASVVIVTLLGSSPLAAQDKAATGAALFTSQKCAMCHSVADKGNKKGPLDGVGKKLKVDDIRQWLTKPEEMRAKVNATRTPAMKDPKLTAQQVDALVAYLETLK